VGGYGFALKKHIFGNYYIIASDVIEDASLSYLDEEDKDNFGEIIGATVFAVGFNDNYIIAKQYCTNSKELKMSEHETIKVNYYILPVLEKMDWRNKNGLIGPLNEEQFEVTRELLHLTNVEFSINIDM